VTTYRCRQCTSGDGRPVYHPGKWACPKEAGYDAGKLTRYNERRSAAARVMKEGPPPPPAPASGAPAAPASAPTQSPGLQTVELGTRIAETARRDAGQKQEEKDWLLPAESSETFFGTIRNGLRMFSHWLDDVMDARKTEEGEIKDSVFEMNQHDLAAARGGFGQRLATKAVKAMGARTLEEGIATVDSMAFLTMFAQMFLAMAGHFWKVGAQSPRLKKWREAAEKRRLEAAARREEAEKKKLTEKQKREARDTTATPAPSGAPG